MIERSAARGAGGGTTGPVDGMGRRVARAVALLRGALGLIGRAALPLLRTVLAGGALLLTFVVPAWIWLQVAARVVDLTSDPTARPISPTRRPRPSSPTRWLRRRPSAGR